MDCDNPIARAVAFEIKRIIKNKAIIVNIAGFSIEDYLDVIHLLEEIEGIDGYEINISCPNVKAAWNSAALQSQRQNL